MHAQPKGQPSNKPIDTTLMRCAKPKKQGRYKKVEKKPLRFDEQDTTEIHVKYKKGKSVHKIICWLLGKEKYLNKKGRPLSRTPIRNRVLEELGL